MVITTALLFVVASMASPQAPVPASLRTAKTAYLVNRGLDPKRLDDLAGELARWGRLRLVDRQTDADVLIELGPARSTSSAAIPVFGVWMMADTGRLELAVTEQASREPLWRDQVDVEWTAKGAVRHLVKDLRTRLDAAFDGATKASTRE
jgi:hypothetical protein